MKTRGFTLIEVMIVVAIAAILLAVIIGAVNSKRLPQSDGTVCIGGYAFVKPTRPDLPPVQILNNRGAGILCKWETRNER